MYNPSRSQNFAYSIGVTYSIGRSFKKKLSLSSYRINNLDVEIDAQTRCARFWVHNVFLVSVAMMATNPVVEVVPIDYVSGSYLDAIFETFHEAQLDLDDGVQEAFEDAGDQVNVCFVYEGRLAVLLAATVRRGSALYE